MKSTTCPKCKSENIALEDYMGIECMRCLDCGYDETTKYDVYPEEKKSQKAKGRYTPYKAGGGKRTRKI